MAIVVLIDSTIAPVGVKCLTVLIFSVVVPGVIHFVILEQCILTLPGPDTGCNTAKITLAIVALIDLPSGSVRNIMFNQRTEAIHGRNGVASRIFNKITSDYNIRGTITPCHFVRDFLGDEMIPVGRVGQGNSPAADILYNAVLNSHIMIAGDASLGFVLRVKYSEVNTTIVHVLVVDITFYILDIQMIQINVVQGTFVLSNYSNTGTIHCMKIVIGYGSIDCSVGHCNVPNLDISAVI